MEGCVAQIRSCDNLMDMHQNLSRHIVVVLVLSIEVGSVFEGAVGDFRDRRTIFMIHNQERFHSQPARTVWSPILPAFGEGSKRTDSL